MQGIPPQGHIELLNHLDDLFRSGSIGDPNELFEPLGYDRVIDGIDGLRVIRTGLIEAPRAAHWAGRLMLYAQTQGLSRPAYEVTAHSDAGLALVTYYYDEGGGYRLPSWEPVKERSYRAVILAVKHTVLLPINDEEYRLRVA